MTDVAPWPKVRLKYTCQVNPAPPRVPDDQEVSFVPMETVSERGGIRTNQTRLAGAVRQGYTGFADGDVVLAKITPCFENGKGSVVEGMLGGIGYGTTELHVLRSSGADRRWLFYVTQSALFMGFGEGSMYGAGGQKRVPPDFVRGFEAHTPPVHTQKAIADFLDRKTAAIDALIEKKQKLLELLAEKRAALINQAVTKGLDPNVPMKDSGIPWIGEIPAHWAVAPLYSRYSVQLGKMLDGSKVTGRWLAPYLRNANVQWDRITTDDLRQMDFTPSDREKFALRPGDIMMCEGGANSKVVGRSAIWAGGVEECFYQKALHRIRAFGADETPRFLLFAIQAACAVGLFVADANANIYHLPAEKLRVLRFAFPPVAEQVAIVGHLDRTLTASRQTARRLGEQLELLQEYRQALITAAVTGQLDVSDAA